MPDGPGPVKAIARSAPGRAEAEPAMLGERAAILHDLLAGGGERPATASLTMPSWNHTTGAGHARNSAR
jgi:hypothetical protein